MKIRKGLSLIGVAVVALTGVAVAAGPASASTGGGCGMAGFDVVGCISASGMYIEPDYYVLPDRTSHCTKVTFVVWDDTPPAKVILNTDMPCSAKHYGPWPIVGNNGDRYHSLATMVTTSGPQTSSRSPELTLSY